LILVVLFLAYIVVFFVTMQCIQAKDVEVLVIPEYSHELYNSEINSHMAIIAQRTYDSDDVETLNYRVIFYNQGRYIGGSEPGYRISSFSAKSGMVKGLATDEIQEMYYFTEQTGSTSTSHNFTVSTSDGTKHPKYFYSRLQYRVGSENKVATFQEEVMLTPENKDIERWNKVYQDVISVKSDEYKQLTGEDATNKMSEIKSLNIENKDGTRVGSAQFTVTRDESNGKYSCTLRVNKEDRTSPYHIDCQSYIETTNGKYLPFIGVYNFSSDHDYYNSGSYSLYDETKGAYLCIKVVFYDADGNSTTSYYKQELSLLTSAFAIGNSGVSCTYNN